MEYDILLVILIISFALTTTSDLGLYTYPETLNVHQNWYVNLVGLCFSYTIEYLSPEVYTPYKTILNDEVFAYQLIRRL